jgi:hypothetical protein
MKIKPILFIGTWEDSGGSSGKRLSISSRTSCGVSPDGKIDGLVPRAEDVRLHETGVISLDEFKDRYIEHVEAFGLEKLAPGKLVWGPFSFFDQHKVQPVLPGDFVFCARVGSPACHELWAAQLLVQAGWNVVWDVDKFSA